MIKSIDKRKLGSTLARDILCWSSITLWYLLCPVSVDMEWFRLGQSFCH